jgi:hypothetical protein
MKGANDGKISLIRLKEVMEYDPTTGLCFWRKKLGSKAMPGCQLGNIDPSKGYYKVNMDGIRFYVHRLIYFYMTGQWPDDEIDHIDRDRANNKWINLRAATKSQNKANTCSDPRNCHGVKGISRRPDTGKWQAEIKVNQRKIYLGVFVSPEEAHAAYLAAAREYFGEFARGS